MVLETVSRYPSVLVPEVQSPTNFSLLAGALAAQTVPESPATRDCRLAFAPPMGVRMVREIGPTIGGRWGVRVAAKRSTIWSGLAGAAGVCFWR
jgi:hypothetical protein